MARPGGVRPGSVPMLARGPLVAVVLLTIHADSDVRALRAPSNEASLGCAPSVRPARGDGVQRRCCQPHAGEETAHILGRPCRLGVLRLERFRREMKLTGPT